MMPITTPIEKKTRKPRKERTQEEVDRANHSMLKVMLGMLKRKQNHINLTKAQAKRVFQALHTITLYLHQPEKVRSAQVERILEVRDMFESEYEGQLKEPIDKPTPKKK